MSSGRDTQGCAPHLHMSWLKKNRQLDLQISIVLIRQFHASIRSRSKGSFPSGQTDHQVARQSRDMELAIFGNECPTSSSSKKTLKGDSKVERIHECLGVWENIWELNELTPIISGR